MQKKTKYRSPLRDTLVVVLCLSISAYFIWLFWKDLNAYTTRADKESIGTIYFKQNIAQRKFDDRVVWERIPQNAALYYGDTLRTADFAQAQIRFNDGTVLDVYENTMIQIYYSEDGGLQISVDDGDIQVDSSASTGGQEVALKLSDGSEVNMEAGGSLAVKADAKGGGSNVEVKSGNAQVTTETGATAALTFGESVSLEKGSDEIKKNPVTVISPPKEMRILNIRGEAMPVKVEWKRNASDEKDAVIIETSRSKDFSAVLSRVSVSDKNSTELSTESGTLYWRVFTEDTKAKPVEGRIITEKISRVQGIAPATSSEFRYRSALPRLGFRWNGNDYAEKYRFLVSSTPDMRTVVAEREVSDQFITLDTFAEGTYYWQVTPFYALNDIGYEGASEVYSFVVVKNDQIKPPELSVPAERARLTYRDNVNATFMWKSELKDASYDLTVARDSDFSDIVFATRTKDTRVAQEFSPDELGAGTYFWRILRTSDDPDDVNRESEIRTFTLVHYVPEDNKLLYPPENFSTERSKLAGTQFMWKLADDYTSASAESVFQISRAQNFDSIQFERTLDSATFENLSLDEGTYYWRVGAKTVDGIEGITAARMFTVIKELEIPEFLAPLPRQEVVVYNDAPVQLLWKQTEDADYYSIKIFDDEGELVAQDNAVYGSSARFTLQEASYTAHIQAVSQGEAAPRLSARTSVSFSVRTPTSIQAQTPPEGLHIDGLTALRKPTVFLWQPGKDKTGGYTFVLLKQQNDGSTRVVQQSPVTRTTTSLDRLTEGNYIWRVTASTPDGIPLDSADMHFTVEPIPDLPRPNLISPPQQLVMDGAYLRSHRTITFVWQAVPGATDYTFTLSKREGAGYKVIRSDRNVKRTQVAITDLSVLDLGEFVWTVTPYSYAADGYEEQRGKVATGAFTIDFAEPTKIETVKQENMYGE